MMRCFNYDHSFCLIFRYDMGGPVDGSRVAYTELWAHDTPIHLALYQHCTRGH
jgi:hypothetical protein